MTFGLNKNLVSPIGIDFGAQQLKLLQVTNDQAPMRLLAVASRQVPDDHPDRDNFLVDSIRNLIARGGFAGRRAIASIPAPLTFVQHVRVPHGQTDEIDRQIAAKLNVDSTRLVIRHIDVNEVNDNGSPRREYIGMAVARGTVLHYINLLKRARLDAVGLYCEPMAIVEGFAHRFRRAGDEQRTTFFVDIGASSTKALIAHGTQLKFTKLIAVGGKHFDHAYAQELSIDLAEARQRRRNQADQSVITAPAHHANRPLESVAATSESMALLDAAQPQLPDRRHTEPPAVGQPNPEMISPGGEMLDCLIDELQLCAGYHSSIFPDRPVERLIFLGGEANHAPLCRRIAETLGLPGELGDPLGGINRADHAPPPIDMDLRRPAPGWAVPLGLCRLPANL